MYEEFFRLSASPFRLSPDPRFFFGSRSHNKAMAYLHYGLRQGEGFIVITGEVGAGKTVLIGHLLDQLDRSNVVAAHLLTTNFEPDALLPHILSAFRIEPSASGKTAELEAFEDFLFDQLNRGRRVLLIVDEAQNLPPKTLEELRMLSNMDYDGTPLFQVFLVGQPQFRAALAAPDMEQFRQRVIASYHLEPLSAEETKEYVRHRLSVVGWSNDPEIADGAFEAIHARTLGIPRKINALSNRLLLHCAVEKAHAIDRATVEAVAADLDEERFDADQAASAELPSDSPLESAVGGAVVVSFGAGRRMVAPAKPPETAETSERAAETAAADQEQESLMTPRTDQPQPESVSVFDRLRARRRGTPPLPESPAEATLEDVAEAIAAASARGPDDALALDEEPEAAEPQTEPLPDMETEPGRMLGETRDDLKGMRATLRSLRRRLSEFERRRGEKRKRIAASLMRAERLLEDVRNARR